MHKGLVSITRITQDGLRVRASAGQSSFGKRERLEACLKQAEEHLAQLKAQSQQTPQEALTRQAARESAAADRAGRVREAMQELSQIEAAGAKTFKKHNQQQRKAWAPRASTTDPQARKMKMPNGGFNPAYNVQLAADPASRAIVGVEISQSGSDCHLSEPMRQQVEQRAAAAGIGQQVSEHLLDGSYVDLEEIDRAEQQGVSLYTPVPQANKEGVDRFQPRPEDSDAVARWRQRMASQAAATIYAQRASTSETINADVRTYRGLARFLVRGVCKVKCVALWSALAYNLMHFGPALLT
jgi:hypothetical protein